MAGVVSAGSAAALLPPTTEPAEFHAGSIAVGVADPGRPSPEPSESVSSSPETESSSSALPSRSPSWKSPAALGQRSPSPAASAKPTPAPAEVTVLSAHRERDLRSIVTEQQTEIDFVNHRDEPVVIHWLDYQGTRERYVVLDSGDTRQQPTYVGHPWVVTDVKGQSLVVFLPATRPAQATIT
ncbi:hypothetical protein QLQ12_25940 [Actinoplanes sp. NEAU-A12]|uniref:von Hippel-Lindau disease tumour suppressor beta domain-containing protein n=1 Tax=Actinoplanes sandaracinus TaxID=3045177 RepID=A0ABT6WR02_9ACTN|nr:hypothetical protein [Actinoplanes sandaracinus]MDI6102065.1 hypothetical protein [Actinoplanes sandaracinus]